MTSELCWSKKVGAMHHERWMGAAIYILIIVIVSSNCNKMGKSKAHGVVEVAFFITYIYSSYWFSIPVAADAPYLTQMFWKDFKEWTIRDPALSAACLCRLDLHTWYLSPRHMPLASFSSKVVNYPKLLL